MCGDSAKACLAHPFFHKFYNHNSHRTRQDQVKPEHVRTGANHKTTGANHNYFGKKLHEVPVYLSDIVFNVLFCKIV